MYFQFFCDIQPSPSMTSEFDLLYMGDDISERYHLADPPSQHRSSHQLLHHGTDIWKFNVLFGFKQALSFRLNC